MTVESATYIHQLNDSYPAGTDYVREGDNHIRLIKTALQNTFTSSGSYDLDSWATSISANNTFRTTFPATVTSDIADCLSDAEDYTDAALADYTTTATLESDYEPYLVPIGTIILWNGNAGSVPDGWKTCDGSTYARSDGAGNITTPDLVTSNYYLRFTNPAGYGTTGGSSTATSGNGGAHSHTNSSSTGNAGSHAHTGTTGGTAITVAQMPSHNHGGGSHTHVYTRRIVGTGASGASATAASGTENQNSGSSGVIITSQGGGASHAHSITSTGDHSHTVPTTDAVGDHTHSVSIVPPYYMLVPLMKI